jgi:excisionase family DNA binding protein
MRKGADSAMIITPPDEAVWNKPETAEFLKIKVRTLDDWIRKKRIPFAKLPSGTVRFRKSQVLDFIAKYEVGQ